MKTVCALLRKEKYSWDLYVNTNNIQNTGFHTDVCVPVQSKPMSYTEIREEHNSFDIKASAAATVIREEMHMPHDLLFYTPPPPLPLA